MNDDGLHYEATPGGGVRVQGAGIELTVSREAIERAERENGLGFNVALTGTEHETMDQLGDGFGALGSPIDSVHNFGVHIRPHDPDD